MSLPYLMCIQLYLEISKLRFTIYANIHSLLLNGNSDRFSGGDEFIEPAQKIQYL
jgi:hypothetical protein